MMNFSQLSKIEEQIITLFIKKNPQIQQRIVLILEVSEGRKNSHKTKTNLFGGSVSSHDSEDHRLPLE